MPWTSCGVSRSLRSPSPSWPTPFAPHVYTWPLSVTAMLNAAPHATCSKHARSSQLDRKLESQHMGKTLHQAIRKSKQDADALDVHAETDFSSRDNQSGQVCLVHPEFLT